MRELQTRIPRNKVIKDRYIVEELLGQGGFGAVYRVRDRRVKGNVFALKETSNPNRSQRESFIFEGELLRRLDHPSLPRVYRVFEDTKYNRICTLMDYISGPNLERLRLRQQEKRFSLPQVLYMLEPIRDALIYLHGQQPPIIHRDIKPSNIIIPPDQKAVLVDFGIAKEYDEDSTTTAIRHCSPGFGAPEQYVSGTSTLTDIYGLGATIYTLLTGTVPIDALYRLTNLSVKHEDPLKLATELVPSIPMKVSEVLKRSMAINGADRYSSVEEFWQFFVDAAPVSAPSTEPVANLNSVRAVPSKSAVAAASASTQPDLHTSVPRAIDQDGGPKADAHPDISENVVATDPLPAPSVHVVAQRTSLLRSMSTHRFAYALLSCALLVFIAAGSLGVYVYANAAGSDVSGVPLATATPKVQAQATPGIRPSSTSTHATPTSRPAATSTPEAATATPTPVPQVVSTPTVAAATPTVQETPVETATSTPQTKDKDTGSYPVLGSSYSGTIHNTPASVDSTMGLSQIQQTRGTITGRLSLGAGLIGAGSFKGSVTTGNQVSFLVPSSGGSILPLFFQGQLHSDGSMSGSYCSYSNNQCDKQSGYGTWSVTP